MFGFLARLFRRLFSSAEAGEDFIMRIQKGDIEYIVKVGVPTIEAPPTPGPRPLGNLYMVAEGVDVGSLLLTDPEALVYILMSAEGVETIQLRGEGRQVLDFIANTSKRYSTPIYVFSLVDSGELRVLAYKGFVTGIYYEQGDKIYVGRQAIEALMREKLEPVHASVTYVRRTIMDWDDEKLSVYIRGLDNQHKYLVNTLNSLYHATVGGEGYKVLKDILTRLIEYTKFHFRSEEILMEKYDYPQDRFERHKAEHDSFVKAVSKFREKYERGEADLTIDVFKFLAHWVENHIAKTDRDYGIYFKKMGVASIVH